MNKTFLLTSVFLSISLSPLAAFSQADSQYPAANFEPKVIFIDTSANSNTKGSDQDSSQAHAKKAEFDPQHPAAFFQPKVIYP